MKTKAVRLYGKKDLRLEEFELPDINDDEILASVITDSICMSSWKLANQGSEHKKTPTDLEKNPIIIGHEFCGEFPHTATLGEAVALSSKDAFYRYGQQGLEDVRNNKVSQAVEEIALDIVVSTGYASNLVNQPDFYYNSCHAHAFYNGTTAIKREGEYLHGMVVSYGVLVLHAYFDEQEELERVAEFNKALGLPIKLQELGLTQEDIPKIVEVALTTNEYRNTPFDPEKFAQAIRTVDQFGQQL